jgi:hypothetical protein
VSDGTGGYHLVRYSGYGWLAAQPASSAAMPGATQAVMLGGLTGCAASYSTALANIGLLNLRLTLGDSSTTGAKAQLLQQLTVDNTP